MKGPSIQAIYHECTHKRGRTHAYAHTPGLNPSPPAAGLSEASVISCPARLNYDVNKSPLDHASTPTSHVSESTCAHVDARTHTHTYNAYDTYIDFNFFVQPNRNS